MEMLYRDCIGEYRSVERTEDLMRIVRYLYDADFNSLDRITDILALDKPAMDIVIEVESLIINNAILLCQRLGIEITFDNGFNNPRILGKIIDMLMIKLEVFEDVSMLLNVIAADTTPDDILCELFWVVQGVDQSHFYDIEPIVDQRLINTIRGVLVSRSIDMDDKPLNKEYYDRLRAFIHQHPTNPVIELLDNLGYMRPTAELVESLEVPLVHDNEIYLEDLAVAIAGIMVAKEGPLENLEVEISNAITIHLDTALDRDGLKLTKRIDAILEGYKDESPGTTD